MINWAHWFARWRSPLARRLVLSVVAFSVVVTLVLSAVQIYINYRDRLDAIEAQLIRIEHVHVKAIAQSLWATNQTELTLQLEGITQNPSFEYATVLEKDRIWAHAGQRKSAEVIERHFPIIFDQGANAREIGMLVVGAGRDALYRGLSGEMLEILFVTGTTIFLVAAFILTFLHWLITRHLLTITEHVRSLNPNTVPPPLKLERHASRKPDEFDELAAALNQMGARTHEAMMALAEGEQRFHAIADFTVDWETWVGPDGQLRWVNSSVQRVTGYTPAECMAMAEFPIPLIHDADVEVMRRELSGALRGSRGSNVKFRIRAKSGATHWVAASWQPIYSRIGEFLGHRSSFREIGEMIRIEVELQDKVRKLEQAELAQKQLAVQAQQERARLVQLLAAMNIGILLEDTENRVAYTNPTFRRIWLIADEISLSDRPTRDVMGLSANVLARPDNFSRHILQVLGTHEVSETFEIVMADGRVVTQLSYPVRDGEGRFIGRLWVYEDVTRERQTAEQLIYLAERDSLTGLYNRHRFQEELARMLVDVDRRASRGALLFFDLDEFKYINDNFGHRAGDAMLIRVAGEVNALVRRNEIIARIGGDEFAILLPDAEEVDATRLAERVIRAIAQIPFRFEGQNLRLTTSLGIALYPVHGANAEDLIAHADAAMYQAKEAGKNAWRVYRQDRDASREMLHRLSWHDRISTALEENLFRLHFQGVFDATSQRLCHVEALVRMADGASTDRVIMPGHFVPAAEKTGKILDIDRWVVRESVALLARLPELPGVAVNISGRSFDEPSLPQYIAEQLSARGVAPSRLLVELTETAAVTDLHDAQRFIEALRHSGCRVCLDDFGSGFSSFAYLKHLKADVLKIDGLFIRDLPNDHDNQVFVKSIVDVARGMRKTTIAEFVEDADTLAMLARFGVDMVQGYHLHMPSSELPLLESAAP